MPTLEGGCNPNISFTLTTPVGTNPNGSIPEVLNLVCQFANGTGANQVSKIHAKTYSLPASTPEEIDLQSLVDLSGAPISFDAIAFMAYQIKASNDAFAVTFGGAGANEWVGFLTAGSKFVGQPSTTSNHGFMVLTAPNATGMPVTPTSRLLKLDPGANAVDVDLVLAGR